MPNSETKKEKEETIGDWFGECAERELNPPTKEFMERLKQFKVEVIGYQHCPTEFHVMGDALLSFYKISQTNQKGWLSMSTPAKTILIADIEELEDKEEILNRIASFCETLFYTFIRTGMPIYKVAANTILYVLSGDEGFLTNKGFSYYHVPKTNMPPRDIPDQPQTEGHEGMFG